MKLAALLVACLALVIAVATYILRHSGDHAPPGQLADRCSRQQQTVVDRLGLAAKHLRDGKADDAADVLHGTGDRMEAVLAICFPATGANEMDAEAELVQRAREAKSAEDVDQVLQSFTRGWSRSTVGDGWFGTNR